MSEKYVFLESADSTNAEARRLIEQGESGDFVIIADRQTAGRGRLGRSFFSQEGGLFMTVCFSPSELTFLTSKAALDVCTVLEKYGLEPKIKWVNDVYIDKRKICGILAERVGDRVIVGVGLNCGNSEFPDELKNKAGSVFLPVSPREIGVQIAGELLHSSFSIEEYRRRSLLPGLDIVYTVNGETKSGKVTGIDDACGLIVDTPLDREVLRSGEISIVKF